MAPAFIIKATRLVAKAFSEIREVNTASKEVFRYAITAFVEWIALKYKCMKIRQKMLIVKSFKEWEEYAKVLD